MMKKSNKGLSLIELIVAIAIFAIAGIAICAFVSFCTNNFTISNRNVKLQYEQQIVVNRVRDIIMETSRGISYDATDKKLIVLSENPYYIGSSGTTEKEKSRNVVTQIRLDTTTDPLQPKLMLGNAYLETIAEGTTLSSVSITNEEELSDTVTEFIADLSEVETTHKVHLKVTFKTGDKEITVTPEISLRNLISLVEADTDISKVYEKETIEIYSHVQSVVISRDGHSFAQSKTDVIGMAGSSSSVKYDATVNKKKSYNGTINTAVTWEIDPSTIDATKTGFTDGTLSAISISDIGLLTVREITVGGTTYQPTEFVRGNYIVIQATSVEDTTKSARLRIKINTNGVYPSALATTVTKTLDYTNGQLIFVLKHKITYTDGSIIEGDAAYDKVRYVSCVDQNGNNPPKGGGFIVSDTVDGTFIATKSMEGLTYTVKVAVIAKDKDGQEISTESTIEIKEGDVPDQKIITVPKLSISTSHDRGSINYASASWSNGLPTYSEKDNKTGQMKEAGEYAFYKFEYEIVQGENGDWSSTQKIKDFKKNIYFANGIKNQNVRIDDSDIPTINSQAFKDNQKKQLYECEDTTKRIAYVYCEPSLFWNSNYTYKVNLRVKVCKTANGNYQYYMKPGTDANDPYLCVTNDKDMAYVETVTVTIPKVALTLTPAEGIGIASNDWDKNYSVYSIDKKVSNGYRPESSRWNDWNTNQRNQARKKNYRVYTPEFTGIKVTVANYSNRIKDISHLIDNNNTPALLTYSYAQGSLVPNKSISSGYSEGLSSSAFYTKDKKNASGLYVYICMTPLEWDKNNQIFPYSGRWTCRINDKSANSVNAKFVVQESGQSQSYDFAEYIFPNHYEGE